MKNPDIPKLLQSWRRRHALTQAAAAAELGTTQRTIENWEQAIRAPRGLARFALLAHIKKT